MLDCQLDDSLWGYWGCKLHLWYLVSVGSTEQCGHFNDSLMTRAVHWLLNIQNVDGGWECMDMS